MRLLDRITGNRGREKDPKAQGYDRVQSPAATEADIYYCFRLLLNRTPGRKEWHGHRLTAGTDLQEIVAKFLGSAEFKTRKLVVAALEETDHEIVELPDMRLYISSKDNVCGSLRSNGHYEPAVTSLIRKVLSEGMTFVDLGANIGYFSVLASKLVGRAGQVFAVEPYPYNVKILQANLRLNSCENVEVLPFAAAEKRGILRYDDSAGNSGNVLNMESDFSGLLGSCLVYAVRLEEVLQPEKPVDLIKMDIEGAEYVALKGMERLARTDRPIIFSEIAHDFLRTVSKVPLNEYLDLLLIDEGYRLGIIRDPGRIELYGRAVDKVVERYFQQESMCLDIVAYPVHREATLSS